MTKYESRYMREIGSEFWEKYDLADKETAVNEVFLLSGRTALSFIINDICRNRSFRKVLLPSYCCESMIEPFTKVGIDVQFYQVDSNCIDYPYDNDVDAVLLLDYFGYISSWNFEIACREKSAGKIVIYDSTHKLDGNPQVQKYADYSFCSYRKWFYCNYARAVKYNGEFDSFLNLISNNRYVELRDQAAIEKQRYFEGLNTVKDVFLSKFSAAEQMLDEDYSGYLGIPVSYDFSEIVSKRKENASYLIMELKEISGIKLWRDEIHSDDLPMFVPIMVDPAIRDDLRRALIKERIYCPVHWPKSHYHSKFYEIYDMEISLICDQRYDIADMERMIQVIKDYFNR